MIEAQQIGRVMTLKTETGLGPHEALEDAFDGEQAGVLERLRQAIAAYLAQAEACSTAARVSPDLSTLALLARQRAGRLSAEVELRGIVSDAARALAIGLVDRSERDALSRLAASAGAYLAARSREKEFAAAFNEFQMSLDHFESEVLNRLCCERELRLAAATRTSG